MHHTPELNQPLLSLKERILKSLINDIKNAASNVGDTIGQAFPGLSRFIPSSIDTIDDPKELSYLLAEAWYKKDYKKAKDIIKKCIEREWPIQCVKAFAGNNLFHFSMYYANTDLLLQIIQQCIEESGREFSLNEDKIEIKQANTRRTFLDFKDFLSADQARTEKEHQGRHPVHNAFYSGDLKAIFLIVAYKPELLFLKDTIGQSILYYALKANPKNKNQAAVWMLLKKFSASQAHWLLKQNFYQEHAFHKVCDSYPLTARLFFKWIAHCKKLPTKQDEQSFADFVSNMIVTYKNNKGQTALEYAKSKRNRYCIQQLSLYSPSQKLTAKKYPEFSPEALCQAIEKDDFNNAKKIIKECFIQNIPLNVVKNDDGLHIFHLAALKNKTQELLDLFVNSQQETFATTNKTWQQLEGEDQKGQDPKLLNLKAYFLAEGEGNSIGLLPLHLGIANGDVNAIRTSLNYGVSLTAKGPNNQSILHYTLKGQQNLFELWSQLAPEQRENFTANDLICLLEPSTRGKTPFHYACKNKNTTTVHAFFKWLQTVKENFSSEDQEKLAQKIKENLQHMDSKGRTAFDTSINYNKNYIENLFECGAEIPEEYLLKENLNHILRWLRLGAPITDSILNFAIQLQDPCLFKEIFIIRGYKLPHTHDYFSLLKDLIFPNLKSPITIQAEQNLNGTEVIEAPSEKVAEEEKENSISDSQNIESEEQEKLKKVINLFYILEKDEMLTLKDVDELVSDMATSDSRWNTIAANFHSLQQAIEQTLLDPQTQFTTQKLPEFFRSLFSNLYFYEYADAQHKSKYQSELQAQLVQLFSELQVQLKFGNTQVAPALALFLSSVIGSMIGLGVGGALAAITLSILSGGFAAPIMLPLLIGVLASCFTAGVFAGSTTGITYSLTHFNFFEQGIMKKEAHQFQDKIETTLNLK